MITEFIFELTGFIVIYINPILMILATLVSLILATMLSIVIKNRIGTRTGFYFNENWFEGFLNTVLSKIDIIREKYKGIPLEKIIESMNRKQVIILSIITITMFIFSFLLFYNCLNLLFLVMFKGHLYF